MENKFLFRAPPPSDDKPLTCPTTKTTSSKKKNIPVISIAESPAPLELKLLRANDGSLCLDALIYLIYPSFICFSIFILLCTSHCFTEFISVQFSKSLSTFFNISRSWEISRYQMSFQKYMFERVENASLSLLIESFNSFPYINPFY